MVIYYTQIFSVFIAYLIGSIPSGFLIARFRGITDIRSHGSGNIGATNVARALGLHYFFLVFFIDFIKAYAYVNLLMLYDIHEAISILSALALLVGNTCSIFLRFSGGKGVSTSFGIVYAFNPFLFLFLLLSWFIILIKTKKAAVASIVALLSLLPASLFIAQSSYPMFALWSSMVLLVIWKHRKNIEFHHITLHT